MAHFREAQAQAGGAASKDAGELWHITIDSEWDGLARDPVLRVGGGTAPATGAPAAVAAAAADASGSAFRSSERAALITALLRMARALGAVLQTAAQLDEAAWTEDSSGSSSSGAGAGAGAVAGATTPAAATSPLSKHRSPMTVLRSNGKATGSGSGGGAGAPAAAAAAGPDVHLLTLKLLALLAWSADATRKSIWKAADNAKTANNIMARLVMRSHGIRGGSGGAGGVAGGGAGADRASAPLLAGRKRGREDAHTTAAAATTAVHGAAVAAHAPASMTVITAIASASGGGGVIPASSSERLKSALSSAAAACEALRGLLLTWQRLVKGKQGIEDACNAVAAEAAAEHARLQGALAALPLQLAGRQQAVQEATAHLSDVLLAHGAAPADVGSLSSMLRLVTPLAAAGHRDVETAHAQYAAASHACAECEKAVERCKQRLALLAALQHAIPLVPPHTHAMLRRAQVSLQRACVMCLAAADAGWTEVVAAAVEAAAEGYATPLTAYAFTAFRSAIMKYSAPLLIAGSAPAPAPASATPAAGTCVELAAVIRHRLTAALGQPLVHRAAVKDAVSTQVLWQALRALEAAPAPTPAAASGGDAGGSALPLPALLAREPAVHGLQITLIEPLVRLPPPPSSPRPSAARAPLALAQQVVGAVRAGLRVPDTAPQMLPVPEPTEGVAGHRHSLFASGGLLSTLPLPRGSGEAASAHGGAAANSTSVAAPAPDGNQAMPAASSGSSSSGGSGGGGGGGDLLQMLRVRTSKREEEAESGDAKRRRLDPQPQAAAAVAASQAHEVSSSEEEEEEDSDSDSDEYEEDGEGGHSDLHAAWLLQEQLWAEDDDDGEDDGDDGEYLWRNYYSGDSGSSGGSDSDDEDGGGGGAYGKQAESEDAGTGCIVM